MNRWFVVVAVFVTALAGAQERPLISGAWARATPPGAATAAVYLEVSLGAGADRLLGARTSAAAEVQLHTHVERDGMAQMQRVEALEIAVERPAVLAPGGDHLMLLGLEQPLAGGATIAVTLQFERAGEVDITVPVLDLRSLPAQEHPQARGHE